MKNEIRLLIFAAAVFGAWSVAERGEAQQRIPATGLIEVKDQVSLSPEIAGLIVEVVPKTEGFVVKEGDVVFRLNDKVIRKEYEQAVHEASATFEIEFARIALEQAEVELKKKQDANAAQKTGTGVFSDSEIRKATLDVEQQKAMLVKAESEHKSRQLKAEADMIRLNQTEVRSTLGGVVTQINRLAGESVSPGDAIITVTDMSTMRADLRVDYAYYGDLKVGDRVELVVAKPKAIGQSAGIFAAPSERPGVLDGLRGEASRSTTPPAPSPAATTGNADTERFEGTVTHIRPELDGSGREKKVQIYASIPNRQDKDGRYLLLQGVEVLSATILSGSSK
ncbi:MAG: HlyD family efflux transporter periplasmic adaptor subunit [Planctomycetaceae bacterium]|nr:HlyD family efflux transporter periplasmic adaptor subunit [Planctomycetaceae bacterium]